MTTQTQALTSAKPTAQTGGVLQRQCACGNHATGGECEECKAKREGQGGLLQRASLTMGQAHDVYEREADRVANDIVNVPTNRVWRGAEPVHSVAHSIHRLQRQELESEGDDAVEDETEDVESVNDVDDVEGGAPETIQTKAETGASEQIPAQVNHDVSSLTNRGETLPRSARSFFEPRFGHDFSRVRVHTDSSAAQTSAAINAKAFTVGQHIVFGASQYAPQTTAGQSLLAHELTHVVQQGQARSSPTPTVDAPIQRKILVNHVELDRRKRRAFRKGRRWASRSLAKSVIEDMAVATDVFDFADEDELFAEVVKRSATVIHMKESQATFAGDKKSFGYPFTAPSAFYGPRVNYAAREYWTPPVVDNYAYRTDRAKLAAMRKLSRGERCSVYGDPCGLYSWSLTDKGKADPYQALVRLFTPQSARKRSLLHCDYLVSLVNFRSLADSIGSPEFNRRVKAYGPDKIVLRWNAFAELHASVALSGASGVTPSARPGLGSLQWVQPSSEADLVIGDHAIFFNHIAYDVINQKIGNAWRLENAVLIEKNRRGEDVFLGHGSGRKTPQQMRSKLAEEYNDVVNMATALTSKMRSPNPLTRDNARAELMTKFPNLKEVGGEWRIQGTSKLIESCPQPVDLKLRRIAPSEVIGPRYPCDMSKLFWVQRPSESKP